MPVRKPTPQEIYDRALQAIAEGRWQTAQRLLEALYHIAPNFEDTTELRKFVNATIKASQKTTSSPPSSPPKPKPQTPPAQQKPTVTVPKPSSKPVDRQPMPSTESTKSEQPTQPEKSVKPKAAVKKTGKAEKSPQKEIDDRAQEKLSGQEVLPPITAPRLETAPQLEEIEKPFPSVPSASKDEESISVEEDVLTPDTEQVDIIAEDRIPSFTANKTLSFEELQRDNLSAALTEEGIEPLPDTEPPEAMQKPPFQITRRLWIALLIAVFCIMIGLIVLGERFAPAKPLTIMERMQTLSPPTETPTNTAIPSQTFTPPPPTPTSTAVLSETASPIPITNTPLPTPTLGIGSTFTSPLDGMTMVYVPEGEFLMGPSKKKVYLDAFWIDQTEITNAMYIKCIEADACSPPARDRYKRADLADHPVIWVNWFQAKGYCQWAGKRLPTEAEWEKAARGTDGRTFPWGNEPPKNNLVNICDQSCPPNWSQKATEEGLTTTVPVGSYPLGASPFGAYDMAGNVWEWVADWYDETTYYSPPEYNPLGPKIGKKRVIRGGSWTDLEAYIRTFHRDDMVPQYTLYNIGFRCAKSP